jgi:hypothetical protein
MISYNECNNKWDQMNVLHAKVKQMQIFAGHHVNILSTFYAINGISRCSCLKFVSPLAMWNRDLDHVVYNFFFLLCHDWSPLAHGNINMGACS